jgi:predicted phosphodiesterase
MTRTIIISDTHLPRGKMRSEQPLLGLLEECDRLVVNGDLAELHQPGMEKTSLDLVNAIKGHADKVDTSLELLAGNHDPEISKWRALGFGDNRIIITHGDAFHMMIAPWARHALTIKKAWADTRHGHGVEKEEIEHRFDAVRCAALAEWAAEGDEATFSTIGTLIKRPRAMLKILRYWRHAAEHARRFSETFFADAEYLVVGHTHRASICKRRNPVVINTGAFAFPGRPRAVVLEGDQLQVIPIRWRGDRFQLRYTHPLLEAECSNAGILTGRWGLPESSGDDRLVD